MSNNPETDLDLEKLFLPAWAQEPASTNRYAKFTGGDDRPERRRDDRRGPRPPRREGPRREFGENRGAERPRGPRREDRGPRPPREAPAGGRRDLPRRPMRDREPTPPQPLPELNVALVSAESSVETLTRQIRMTGRAYPLFGIGQLILQKPERYVVRLSVRLNAEGKPVQPLFACALDESLWLSEDEAVAHVLRRHFATFYQAERTPTEPPKGKYTFVAQCGFCGVILGPPNHHDYQNQLRKLHTERFSRMPFEAFKSRIKIVRDEAVVKQWVDDQSWKTEYVCLNVPEPLKLPTRAEVEQHFRSVHKDTLIKPVESFTLGGPASRTMPCTGLSRLIRQVWEDQKHFPLQLATVLSQQFASHGLQFFKVNRTVTHVSVARPHFLDLEATPVSDGVKRIVEFINSNPKCTRRRLVETLAPSPVVPPAPAAPTPAAVIVETAPPAPAPMPGEGEPPAPKTEAAQPAAAGAAPATPPAPEPTPEQTAIIADLHWLIHQGHVIEFANGVLETAKRPLPRPPKPQPKPAEVQPAAASAEAPAPALAQAEAPAPPEPQADTPTPGESSAALAVPLETVDAPADTTSECPAAPVVDSTLPAEPAPASAETEPETEPETPASNSPTATAEPQT